MYYLNVKNLNQIKFILKNCVQLLVAFFLSLSTLVHAQVGGLYSYSFLDLAENARVAALGGHLISAYDSLDVNTGTYNPANLQASHKNMLSANILPMKGGITKSGIVYAFEAPKLGLLNVSLQHIGYGEIVSTDLLGNEIGTINPQEFAISVAKSYVQGPFSLGASLGFASSRFGEFGSSAVFLDLGGTFVHPTKDLNISLLMDNVGVVLSRYTPNSSVRVPFDVSAAISYKPEHMPVKFHLTAHNLQKGDIQYLDPSRSFDIDNNGNRIPDEKSFSEQVFRHINVGTELMFFKNLHFRVGYNHLRRKELKTETRGGSGFSFGGMLRTKRFTLEFARAYYFAGSGSSVISLSTNFNHFKKNN